MYLIVAQKQDFLLKCSHISYIFLYIKTCITLKTSCNDFLSLMTPWPLLLLVILKYFDQLMLLKLSPPPKGESGAGSIEYLNFVPFSAPDGIIVAIF